MQETEAKLLVLARPIAALWRALAGLTHFGEFSLRERADALLEDTYVDTNDGRLRAADLALRLRRAGDECQLAVKGRAQQAGHVVTRLEMERPYSAVSLTEMLVLLRRLDVPLECGAAPAGAAPEQALAACGLHGWQRRRTARQRREVRRRPAGTLAAELALDTCEYHLADGPARHYEVEIESCGNTSTEEIESMTLALMALFGSALRPWRPSKVATGAALAALAARRGLATLVDAAGVVRPAVYSDIERFLRTAPYP